MTSVLYSAMKTNAGNEVHILNSLLGAQIVVKMLLEDTVYMYFMNPILTIILCTLIDYIYETKL